jgi:hypothetical protein
MDAQDGAPEGEGQPIEIAPHPMVAEYVVSRGWRVIGD